MFKKPHDVSVSSKSLMRGKDAKTLREKITALMPASSVPTDEAGSPIDILLPVHGKNSVELTKFAAKFSGYGIPDERIPFFLDLDSKGQLLRLMPTLHGLWRCPNLVPLTFLIPSAVSVPIIGGADVMLPGILVPRGGLPPFKKGVICTIRVAGNPAPIAVGETLLDRSDAVAAGMRGRGIRVIHHYGDALWDAGGRVRPNDGFRGNMVAPIQREEGFEDEDVEGGDDGAADASAAAAAAAAPTGSVADADLASATSQLAAATISSPDVSLPADTTSPAVVTSNQDDGDDAAATTSGAGGGAGEDAPESEAPPRTPWWRSLEPDALVTAVFLQAIRRHVKASDLPMLSNVLYGTAMQSARPRDIDLDIRKTKWKKVAPFLHSMAEAGVVGIEEDKAKGTMRITGIDKQHPMVKAHRPWPAAEESGAADGEDSEGEDGSAGASSSPAGPTWLPPVVVQYLRPHPAAALVMNTSMAVLVVKGKGGVLPGTLVHKGRRRGGPVTAQALGTVLLKVAELGIGDEGDGSRAAGPSSSSSDAPTLASILSSLPPATSLLLSRPEAAGLVAEYCSARKLADPTNKKNVLLDDALAGALAGRMARVEDVAMATTTTAATPSTAAAAGKGNPANDGYGTLSTAAGAGTKEDEADLDGHGGDGDGHAVDDGGHDEGGDDDGDGSTRPPLPCLPFTPASLSSLACPPSALLDAPSIPREDVAKLFLSKMEKWYSVTYRQGGSGGVAEVIVKRGEPPSVTIAVKRIQGGRRATTHCINADAYRVDLQDLGRTLQRVLAASATVQPCAQNPKLREVMVQGDESARVAEVLTSQYGVPANCVRVEEDDGGAKGKGGGGGKGKAGKK